MKRVVQPRAACLRAARISATAAMPLGSHDRKDRHGALSLTRRCPPYSPGPVRARGDFFCTDAVFQPGPWQPQLQKWDSLRPSFASRGVFLRDTPCLCETTGHNMETVHYLGPRVQVSLVDATPVAGWCTCAAPEHQKKNCSCRCSLALHPPSARRMRARNARPHQPDAAVLFRFLVCFAPGHPLCERRCALLSIQGTQSLCFGGQEWMGFSLSLADFSGRLCCSLQSGRS